MARIKDIKSQSEAERIFQEISTKLNIAIREVIWYSDGSIYFEIPRTHFKITNNTIYAGKEFSTDVEKILAFFIESQGRELIGSESSAAYYKNTIKNLTKWTANRKVDRTIEYLWRKVICNENITPDTFKPFGVIKDAAKEMPNDQIALCSTDSISLISRSNGDRTTVVNTGVSLTSGYTREHHVPVKTQLDNELMAYKKSFMKKIISKEKDTDRKAAMLTHVENSLTRDSEYRVNGLTVVFRGSYVLCADATVDLDGLLRTDGVSFNSANCRFKEAVDILADVINSTSLENFANIYDKCKSETELMKFFRNLPSIKKFLADVNGTTSSSGVAGQGSTTMGETVSRIVDRGMNVAKSTASASIADILVTAAIELISEASTLRLPAKNRKARKAVLKEMYRDPMNMNMLKAAIVVCLEALPASLTSKLHFDVKAVSDVLMVDGSRFIAGQIGELATMMGGEMFRKFQDLLSSDGVKALAEGESTNFMGSFVDIKETVSA